MQKSNNKIYYQLYQLTKYLYGVVKNFPKEHKYNLGNDILSVVWSCLDLNTEANGGSNSEKQAKISELCLAFEKLKIRIRMSQEIRLISAGQFSHIQENYLIEIGQMLGGWLNWAKNTKK